MKKGDRIIFDSGTRYEIGIFVDYLNYDGPEAIIAWKSGFPVERRKAIVWADEVKPYSKELVKELTAKYGYEKAFSEVF